MIAITECPWKIHWGVDQESTTQCGRGVHADDHHEGRHPNPANPDGYTVISWHAGDRREYIGKWPGPCDRTPGCILHKGHVRRCAL